jgi:hypothetical protein
LKKKSKIKIGIGTGFRTKNRTKTKNQNLARTGPKTGAEAGYKTCVIQFLALHFFNIKTWALCCYALSFFKYQNLGFALLCTSDDEMTKKKKGLHMKTLLFSDIYRIQIIQKITQLLSKGRFNQSPLFLIH